MTIYYKYYKGSWQWIKEKILVWLKEKMLLFRGRCPECGEVLEFPYEYISPTFTLSCFCLDEHYAETVANIGSHITTAYRGEEARELLERLELPEYETWDSNRR